MLGLFNWLRILSSDGVFKTQLYISLDLRFLNNGRVQAGQLAQAVSYHKELPATI